MQHNIHSTGFRLAGKAWQIRWWLKKWAKDRRTLVEWLDLQNNQPLFTVIPGQKDASK
jgi:hypothetical protein